MNLCTSAFVYVGSIVLYKRIVNANTQNIRIANADGQGKRQATMKIICENSIFVKANKINTLAKHAFSNN